MSEIGNCDVVILGTGPAGLQAAIHAARRKVSVLVLGKESKSSIFHHHVENYCCVFNTTGEDIITTGRQQAASFGAEFLEEDVLSIAMGEGRFKITLCTNLPCALSGAGRAAARLKEKLGIGFGETTADGCFSLKEGECMGACGDAPVLLVNNQRMCSFMSADKLDALIAFTENGIRW